VIKRKDNKKPNKIPEEERIKKSPCPKINISYYVILLHSVSAASDAGCCKYM